MAVIAAKLAVSWHNANSTVLTEGNRLLINDETRFDNVSAIGVDDFPARFDLCVRYLQRLGPHSRGDNYVTVIIDLTPINQGTGLARLLNTVHGRSKQVFKQWWNSRPYTWRSGIEIVAMDGFTGYKTAAAEELPDAVHFSPAENELGSTAADKLAGDALDDVRRRI